MARYEYNAQTGETTEHEDLPVVYPSPAELQAQYTATLDAFIDATAKMRGYDNRVTCALRAGYPGPLQAEGQAFALWMESCYAAGRQVLADVMSGARTLPTPEAFIAEMPPMVWPEAAQ
ncbi:hypothetical protein F3K02_08945 [Hydrogenophaga sp. D2P1]|uniref:Uncharacterized protein n=1 Tax=Hydrogenophaga aromaticivorans TaxID=2610898 RepID=A0A7Y8KX99_9BURK|nr:hypothetical protein [Hydrogenophaga aromaticivorans]NWF45372.1 hypothetical protein [Hydrogenophaga aromaticivorans]